MSLSLFNHLLCQDQPIAEESDKISFYELYFDIGDPTNSYGSRVLGNAYGVSGIALWQFSADSPRFVGIETSYQFFDSYSVTDVIVIEGEDVEVRDRTSTHEIALYALGRYYLPFKIKKVEFFSDMRIGLRYLYAYSTVYDLEFDENISSDINSSGVAINLGLGVGLQIPFNQYISFSTKMIYNSGTKTDYFGRLDNNPSDFSLDAFQTYNSTTDLITYSIGLSWLH